MPLAAILAVASQLAPPVVELITKLAAEKRDPTPEEVAAAEAAQAEVNEEWAKRMPKD